MAAPAPAVPTGTVFSSGTASTGDRAASTVPFDADLADADPEIAAALSARVERRRRTLEMTALANIAPVAVRQALSTSTTGTYAEGGDPRRRTPVSPGSPVSPLGPLGPERADAVGRFAVERARALFGAAYADVRPYSGGQAHAAALSALLAPGDTVLVPDAMAPGGSGLAGRRHGHPGQLYDAIPYSLRTTDGLVDMAEVHRLARAHLPKMIVAGGSAHPRRPDYERFRRIADEVGALLLVDMAHATGLVAAGLHPSPVPHAHVVTASPQTLGGPPGGMLLTNDAYVAARLNSAVPHRPENDGLDDITAARAVALRIAATPAFRERQRHALRGARILAGRLVADDVAETGIRVLTGATETHVVLVDLRAAALDSGHAADRLHSLGITVDRTAMPADPGPSTARSGLCIGTAALAGREFDDAAFREAADVVARALAHDPGATALSALRARVTALTARHPLRSGRPGR
ncbi:serine hydroxymethyltransferase [Streptomyces sp. SYSU K21746]